MNTDVPFKHNSKNTLHTPQPANLPTCQVNRKNTNDVSWLYHFSDKKERAFRTNSSGLLMIIFHSFIFSKNFIPLRVAVEFIPGALDVRLEYILYGTLIHHRAAQPHVHKLIPTQRQLKVANPPNTKETKECWKPMGTWREHVKLWPDSNPNSG